LAKNVLFGAITPLERLPITERCTNGRLGRFRRRHQRFECRLIGAKLACSTESGADGPGAQFRIETLAERSHDALQIFARPPHFVLSSNQQRTWHLSRGRALADDYERR